MVTSPVPGAAGWVSAGITDVGLRRAHNEDALLDRSDLGLWVVADGMGGHERGEVASAMLCDELARLPAAASMADVVDAADDTIEAVNGRLVDMGAALPGGGIVGSTIVMMIARGDFIAFLWAGDSRLYLLRDGRLSLLSEDHSLHAQLLARGELVDPSTSNVITRAVGASNVIYLDVELLKLQTSDRFLLCSDGLCNELDHASLEQILTQGSTGEAAQRLVESARQSGGNDNITALVADYGHGELW